MRIVTVFQDHTEFISRMIEQAYDHLHGAPLSITLLNAIRKETVAAKYKGDILTLSQLRELAENNPAEARDIGIVMANAVEADLEGWYCIADDAGAIWLQDNPHGPVVRWSNAVWWGKIKGQHVPVEVRFDERFKQQRRKPVRSPAQETGRSQYAGAGAGESVFRPAIGEFE